jgi:hypothetical protein
MPREPPQSLPAGAACHGDGGADIQSNPVAYKRRCRGLVVMSTRWGTTVQRQYDGRCEAARQASIGPGSQRITTLEAREVGARDMEAP